LQGVIDFVLSADKLHLLDLVHFHGSSDVFEHELGVFGKVDKTAKVHVETRKAVVTFKEFDKVGGFQLVVVTLGNFHNEVHVSLGVLVLQKVIKAVEGIFRHEVSKKLNQEVWVDAVAADGHLQQTFNVVQVLVVLQSSTVETSSFAHASNVHLVVLGKSEICGFEDSVSNLRDTSQTEF
jgi:hypothetical protein